ncbi:MAG: alpha/beta hydrolase [Pontixanthobacter sp.]
MIGRRTLLHSGALLSVACAMAGIIPASAHDYEEILLWPGKAPGRGGATGAEKIGGPGAGFGAISNIATPRMRVYRPAVANGKAVLVCGGGGYFRIQLWKESTPIAEWLKLRGYTVFELIYRLPNDGWDASVPFMDAQRAMKIIRGKAGEFGVKSDQIGIMGFSAGGHLAGYTALKPDQALYQGSDGYETQSARPDFAALLFPVVSLRKPYDTTRSRREIIGNDPSSAAEEAWSLDSNVTKDAPPMIIFSAADDTTTPPGHGIALFQALKSKGTAAELHIFEEGGHGWGLGTDDQILSQWPSMFENWINKR